MKECRAQNVTCNGCGIKGHLKKCCKKSGNFPKDDSKRQNQSSSTDTGRMNIATTLPQTEAEFFDEKGLLKEYRPPVQQQHTGSMYIFKKVQDPSNAILLSEDGVESSIILLLQFQIQILLQSHLQISHSKNFCSRK